MPTGGHQEEEHYFDRLAKGIASARVSRRGLLLWLDGTLLTTLFASFSGGRGLSDSQAAKKKARCHAAPDAALPNTAATARAVSFRASAQSV